MIKHLRLFKKKIPYVLYQYLCFSITHNHVSGGIQEQVLDYGVLAFQVPLGPVECVDVCLVDKLMVELFHNCSIVLQRSGSQPR